MRFGFVALLVGLLAGIATAAAQETDPDIARYIGLINNGQGDEVRNQIPSLLAKHPNNPGVLYLQGLVTSDGTEAVRVYQSIVDNFPKSEWADDALYKVYQFYYALGLYRTAELKMNQLRKEYPNSKHLGGTGEPETRNLAEERVQPPAPAAHEVAAPPVREPATPRSRFALQVGAFTTLVNAEKQKLFFEQLGYSVEVLNKVKDNRALFLVWVGTYPTYDEAKTEGVQIKKRYNVGSIVITK